MPSIDLLHVVIRPDREDAFIEACQGMAREERARLRKGGLKQASVLKTGECRYILCSEWDAPRAAGDGRPGVPYAERIRGLLDEPAGTAGGESAVSGVRVASIRLRRARNGNRRKRAVGRKTRRAKAKSQSWKSRYGWAATRKAAGEIATRIRKAPPTEAMLGMIDAYRKPEKGISWGGPFNGQPARRRLAEDIMALKPPAAIVETGTYLGATTELFGSRGVPVFTIEAQPRNYGFSRARFLRNRHIQVIFGDSRAKLLGLFDGPLAFATSKTVFAYLDAHWQKDLPLAEEIDIVFARCPGAIVMVDDFKVPDDPGYGFDNYGPGKALTPDYIVPAITRHGLVAFYPATPSAEEGGSKRGCVVLARREINGEVLAGLALLRTIPNTIAAPTGLPAPESQGDASLEDTSERLRRRRRRA